METTKLKKFAQQARVTLIEQVATKLKFVRAEESLARRENPIAVKKLEELIKQQSEQEIVERIAYIWFNRFCALRFMDMNRYNRSLVVSAAADDTQPEVLALAKAGDIDERVVSEPVREQILNLLNGRAPSQNPEAEVYRLLLVAYCNQWHESMPFLFQRIDDYTELLMPDDLLSSSSVLTDMREAMPASACKDVEVIGWLYQFYISDKKDDVISGLKTKKKITPDNIPAATQLFTPHWIVRYLVENSLGRLWLLNNPESNLADSMEFYIKPAEDNDESDFLKINSPEELKICDPACGSGHMLTYAFDLLYKIYEEEGYNSADIPSLILTHNLYGIELDERAGELAAFALTMKARAKQRWFFSKKARPNICVLEAIKFDQDELDEYMEFVGKDLFTTKFEKTLTQFEEADNFGSLIRPELTDVDEVLEQLESKDVSGQLFLGHTHEKVLTVLKQARYLSPRYHVVVANPPYMNRGGMNTLLSEWVLKNYPDVRSDLFSAFIVRNTEMTLPKGQLGFMTPFVWMFISSYEKLRSFMLYSKTITSLIQLEYSGFDGATVPICTFTLENSPKIDFNSFYIRLSDFKGASNQAPKALQAIKDKNCGWSYQVSSRDLSKVPGTPIAYWISDKYRDIFLNDKLLQVGDAKQGLATADNNRFVRNWPEVEFRAIGLNIENELQCIESNKKWFPYNKGGDRRKWYGNQECLVNWYKGGAELKRYELPTT